ncbi:hypothetical protein C5Z04_01800 [Phocaeicola vulgatus]|nr:hypothetical protein C5Z04_01800 [Phocaeicola vulgatus]
MFILLLKLHIHLFRSKIKNNLSFRVQLLGKVLYLNDFNKLNYGRGYKIQGQRIFLVGKLSFKRIA